MGETYRVAVTGDVIVTGEVEEAVTPVDVGRGRVGVVVAGKRASGVIVGTGEERATCRVDIRSCGLPVAGIS